MNKVILFSDGASKGNPGPGGWGVIAVQGEQVTELGGREEHTTNNRMELRAAIEAVRFAAQQGAGEALVYSDSSYVINGITKWVHGWKRNGWVTMEKKAVLNEDLWKLFDAAVYGGELRVSWQYLGGHIGIPGNERVDEIATGFAEGKPVKLYSGALASYEVDVFDLEGDGEKASAKSAARERSKAKAYSYISEVDGIIQTHKTWAECESRVRGKTARFKKALSADEEKEIIKRFSHR